MIEPLPMKDVDSRLRLRRRLLSGVFLTSLGLLIPVAVFLFFFLLSEAGKENGRPWLTWLSIPVFVPAYYLCRAKGREVSINLRRAGRRHYFATDAQDVLSRDSRTPILYLRSFSEEEAGAESRKDGLTAEEVLSSALKDVAPLVAVGNPRDTEVVLGAARFYLKENAAWQPFVEELIERAQLIIINPDVMSDGLRWEIDTSLRGEARGKTLFHFLPHYYEDGGPGKRSLFDVRSATAALVEKELGCRPAPATDRSMFFSVEPGGECRFVEPPSWALAAFGRHSPHVIREALRPPLERRGIKVGGLRTAAPLLALAALTAVSVACWGLILIWLLAV